MDYHNGYSKPRTELELEEEFLENLPIPGHVGVLLALIRHQVLERFTEKLA